MVVMKMTQTTQNTSQMKNDTGDEEESNYNLNKTIHCKPVDNLT